MTYMAQMPTVLSTNPHLFSSRATLANPATSPRRASAIRPSHLTRSLKWKTAQKNAASRATTAARSSQTRPLPIRAAIGCQMVSAKKGPKLLHFRDRAVMRSTTMASTSHSRSQAMVPKALSKPIRLEET